MKTNQATYVLIKTQETDLLRKVSQDFINLYNDVIENFEITAYSIKPDVIILKLPSKIDFDYVCALVFYLKHPLGIDHSFEGIGYVTINEDNDFKDELRPERIMILPAYGSSDEDEVVVFVTKSNKSYRFKLGVRNSLSRNTELRKDFNEKIYDLESANVLFSLQPNSDRLPTLKKGRTKFIARMIMIVLSMIIFFILLQMIIDKLSN